MTIEAIDVAFDVGKKMLVHATGSPAQVVSVGVAAGIAAIATGVGYSLFLSAAKIYELLNSE